ncbi:hypothetical protein NQZ68_015574 [Dissostichus eleginoides]|nr:hypothetical protein NQZ68_015574 [Dissostichus eleginoides]
MEPVAIAPEVALPLTREALITAQKGDPTLTKCFDAAENPNEWASLTVNLAKCESPI